MGAVGCRTGFSGLISVFVFDILQICSLDYEPGSELPVQSLIYLVTLCLDTVRFVFISTFYMLEQAMSAHIFMQISKTCTLI